MSSAPQRHDLPEADQASAPAICWAMVELKCAHTPYGADPCRQVLNLAVQPKPEKIMWTCPDCGHGNVWPAIESPNEKLTDPAANNP